MREVARHPAHARVDLGRLRDNFRAVRSFAAPRAVIAVVKADAYGHGAVEVARALEPLGPDLFAVAYVSEAVKLRLAGIASPILVLTGGAPDQFDALYDLDLIPVVSTPEHVETLARMASRRGGQTLKVHVKVDTGMSRLGFPMREWETALHRLADIDGVRIDGVMTHLASADEDEVGTGRQMDAFEEAIARAETLGERPRFIHAANSAGLSFLRKSHTAVRPGLILYGVRPRPVAPDIGVRPVMEVRARVALVKNVAAGQRVSYGGRYEAPRDHPLATLDIGYADGVPRTDAMRARGYFVSDGRRLPVAGTVCMDLTTVDATPAPALAAGDGAVFLGDDPGAWDVAEWAGTNAWQALTAIGPRIPRVYVD